MTPIIITAVIVSLFWIFVFRTAVKSAVSEIEAKLRSRVAVLEAEIESRDAAIKQKFRADAEVIHKRE